MSTIHRALSPLTVKTLTDGGRRRIQGTASTPTPDRRGDIFDTAGATWRGALPLLLHHHRETPVGTVTLQRSGTAIRFEAELPTIEAPGQVRDEVDRAWTSMTADPPLIRGVSIGFTPLAAPDAVELLPGGGLHYRKSEIVELSLVTVPANADATLAVLMALDTAYRAAAGPSSRPGVAGTPRGSTTMPETLNEQIRSWEATRAATVAQMAAIMAKADEQHVTLDATEAASYDELRDKVTAIDEHLTRKRAEEKLLITNAAPVVPPPIVPRSPTITVAAPKVAKGTAWIRMEMAKVICRGSLFEAAEYAKRWQDTTPEVPLVLKAAVTAATTQDPNWAGALTVKQNITGEFLELLRAATVVDRIPNLREVPFNVSVPAQTGTGVYQWVGEGKPKPLTKLAFSAVTLGFAKVAGIIVLTEEVIRLSNPKAENICRDDMIAGIAAFIDTQFLDPAVAAVANVHPASVTNGVTPITSVGPLQDIVAIAAAFTTARVPLKGLTIVMSPTNLLVLSLSRDAQGNAKFPGLNSEGGTYAGMTFLPSEAALTNVIGIAPQWVLYADDGDVRIDVSREASLQMSDTPMDPADATTVYRSLWQNNEVGLRAERFVNWQKGNANAVKYVSGASYTIPASMMAGEGTAAAVPNGNKKAHA